MTACQLPSSEVLRQLLQYDPGTGKLFWRPRGSEWFGPRILSAAHAANSWNSKFSGNEALASINHHGYCRGHLLGAAVQAHRVIWKYVTGDEPSVIDHVNGDRADNRWVNLRSVDHESNAKNAKLRISNKTGTPGVYRNHKSGKAWVAKICVGGTSLFLGQFDELKDAVRARKEAESMYGFHENHGRNV